MFIHKKELGCFWTHSVLFSLCYFCACVLHTVFSYALTPWFPQSLLRNCCCRKGNLPALICSKTDTPRGAWWATAAIHKKTTLDKSCLFRHITSQIPFSTKLHEASARTMNKKATCFGRNSHTDKQSTSLSSFRHLPPLPVNKPQMFFGIPQTLTALSLLDSQPEYNPSKYLHPSSKQLPADFF